MFNPVPSGFLRSLHLSNYRMWWWVHHSNHHATLDKEKDVKLQGRTVIDGHMVSCKCAHAVMPHTSNRKNTLLLRGLLRPPSQPQTNQSCSTSLVHVPRRGMEGMEPSNFGCDSYYNHLILGDVSSNHPIWVVTSIEWSNLMFEP